MAVPLISPRELEWTAGFLEGEGSFTWHRSCARIQAGQVQLEPLKRLQNSYGGTLRSYQPRNPNGQRITYWCIVGSAAVGIMMTLYGLLSPRRKEQVSLVLREWKDRQTYQRYRTHCRQGHAFSGTNVRVIESVWKDRPRKQRVCLACAKINAARAHQRRKCQVP